MTLILTELSRMGIAMAADSALTVPLRQPDGTIGDKVYYGARKLFPVPNLTAGISYWGWGDVPQPGAKWEDKEKLERTELWLPKFLEYNKDRYQTVSDLAILLEKELRLRIPPINIAHYPFGDGGVHLAGYESIEDKIIPVFWHIHNGFSQQFKTQKLDLHVVNANNDVPLVPSDDNVADIDGMSINEGKVEGITRNGDIEDYVALYEVLFKPSSPFSRLVGSTGLTFPFLETLADRVNLLEFQIQTIAGLYRFSKEGQGIGGPISKLTISPTGVRTYST